MGRVKNKIEQSTSGEERNLIDIAIGKKNPTSKEEKKKKHEIEEIKKKGRFLHIPHD